MSGRLSEIGWTSKFSEKIFPTFCQTLFLQQKFHQWYLFGENTGCWFQKSYREIRKKSSKGSKACFSMIFVLWCNLIHDFNILGGRVAFSIIADKIKQLLSYSIKKIWEIFMNGQVLKNGIYWKKYAKKNFFSRENRILKVLAGRQSAGW